MNPKASLSGNPRDAAYATIFELREKYGERGEALFNANEAKTRLLIIDKTLNILHWNDDDFNPEETAGTIGFTDYLLKIDGNPRLIVEAKRTSQTFRIPRSKLKRYTYKLGYLRNQFGGAVHEVIEQAAAYGQENSVPYAILTNGAEWILAQVALSPGFTNLNDLSCFYFGNIFSDDFNFDLFWETLHKPYVEEGILEEHFSQINAIEVDYVKIPQTEIGEILWNEPQNNVFLKDFYALFFDEMVDSARQRMLEMCFVTDAKLDQYQGELSRALKDAPPQYIPQVQDMEPGEGEKLFASNSGDKKGRVILITGSVGCGKSTFVKKVLNEARQDQERNQVYLVINLIDEDADASIDITAQLYQHITTKWTETARDCFRHEQLRKIFQPELARLRSGPSALVFQNDQQRWIESEAAELERLISEPEIFLQACWRFYREKKNRQVVLFFDNVDRASEYYQRQVYKLAHKLARETGITVIITMREATYFRGREDFLDVRSNSTVYHLQSPNLEQVISRRISYVEKYLNTDYRISHWRRRKDWTEFQNAISDYAARLKQVFLTDSITGRQVLSLLASIAWHDVRYFLRLLGHIHSLLGNEDRPWNIPEIIAALMTPSDFSGTLQIIPNIFQPSYPNYHCYFLKSRIILYLLHGLNYHERNRGVTLERILRFMRPYGYARRWVERAVQEMVQARLLECVEAPAALEYTRDYQLDTSHSFRRSPLAIYMIDTISTEPIYLSLVGNTLPFHKPHAFERYIAATKEVLAALDEHKLERAAIDLIAHDAVSSRIVASYLIDQYKIELPISDIRMHSPEISSTETKLSEIKTRLEALTEHIEPVTITHDTLQNLALPLFQDYPEYGKKAISDIPIPANINEVVIGKSLHGPKIFWALVALKIAGHQSASGAEITGIINDYLVDEHNQKEPTNISRALRRPVLQNQEWLITSPGPLYSVVDQWKQYWENIFNELPPI